MKQHLEDLAAALQPPDDDERTAAERQHRQKLGAWFLGLKDRLETKEAVIAWLMERVPWPGAEDESLIAWKCRRYGVTRDAAAQGTWNDRVYRYIGGQIAQGIGPEDAA